MATILFAWELGGGYGHLDPMFRLGRALEETGHQLHYAVRDLPRAHLRDAGSGLRLLQAPYWVRRGQPLAPALNYSDVLLRCGFEDSSGLAGLLRAWIGLFDLVEPDLILTDHSPAAVLAARCAGVPVASAATSFSAPPNNIRPLPSIQPWRKIPDAELEAKDEAALHGANQACARLGDFKLDHIGDLYAIDANFLCTFPELDHYGKRQGGEYCGPLFGSHGEGFEAWEAQPGPKIFAYLSAGHKHFKPLIEHARQGPAAFLLHSRDVSQPKSDKVVEGNLYISRAPVAMERAVACADLIVGHGGHGTCSAALLGGVPMLLLPQHLEQAFFGHRLAEQGLAAVLGDQKPVQWGPLLSRLTTEPAFAEKARAFARRYAGYTIGDACQKVRLGCDALLQKKA